MMKPYDRLLEYNIKPSMQRIAIMEYLMDHPIHPSADDIYTALSPSMPTLSKTTVYFEIVFRTGGGINAYD